jgi:hypothetical protein
MASRAILMLPKEPSRWILLGRRGGEEEEGGGEEEERRRGEG